MGYFQSEVADGATFMERMLPHLLQGKSLEEAGRAVLARDREIGQMLIRGATINPELREVVVSELAKKVYEAIHKKMELENEARSAARESGEKKRASIRQYATFLELDQDGWCVTQDTPATAPFPSTNQPIGKVWPKTSQF